MAGWRPRHVRRLGQALASMADALAFLRGIDRPGLAQPLLDRGEALEEALRDALKQARGRSDD